MIFLETSFSIQQYYFELSNQDMNLQREVNNESQSAILQYDRQDSDSEGNSNYTLVSTHSAMPPPPNRTFQTREELVNSARVRSQLSWSRRKTGTRLIGCCMGVIGKERKKLVYGRCT